MKKLLIILMLALPTFVGAQSYSDITGRINAGIWQDGSRFQMNTYRRLVIDTLNSLMIGLADYSKNGFLPLTLGGNTTVSGNHNLTLEIGKAFQYYETNGYFQTYSNPVSGQEGSIAYYPNSDALQFFVNPLAAGASITMTLARTTFGFNRDVAINTTYPASYENNITATMINDRHIPDIGWIKGYVDTAAVAGSSYTFSNGLTEASGAVKLGGDVDETTIMYVDKGGFNMHVVSSKIDTAYDYYSYMGVNFFDTYNEGIAYFGYSTYAGDTSVLLVADPVNSYGMGVGLKIRDQRATPRGMEYETDISAGFTARSLVDKGYVDNRAKLGKYNATAAPGTGDDAADGYSVGSMWIDVTNDDAYICVDSTNGAAVWKKITP